MSAVDRSELTNPDRRLPSLELPSVADGALTPLRPVGRRAPVLVLVHGAGCRECLSYLRALAAAHAEIVEWDGRVLAVTPDAPGDGRELAGGLDLPFPLLADPDRRLASRLSLAEPAVVVADQWGVVHAAEEAGDGHRFLPPEEVREWVRHLAVLCPECEGEAL